MGLVELILALMFLCPLTKRAGEAVADKLLPKKEAGDKSKK